MVDLLAHELRRPFPTLYHLHYDGYRFKPWWHCKLFTTQDKAGAMWGKAGDSSQDLIQIIILVIAVICIPVMLLPKPLIEISRLKKHKKENPLLEDHLDEERQAKVNDSEYSLPKPQQAEEHQHDPGEIFVHQLI